MATDRFRLRSTNTESCTFPFQLSPHYLETIRVMIYSPGIIMILWQGMIDDRLHPGSSVVSSSAPENRCVYLQHHRHHRYSKYSTLTLLARLIYLFNTKE